MKPPIPDAALDDRLGFVGTAGSGKTYSAGTGVERLLDNGARCIIIDPLDVWFGLRATESGAGQSQYNVVILGGQHGDLPLNEHAGALVGETVATSAESFIVSLGSLGTKSAERRFMLAFLVALYRHTNGEPVHLIFDEADMWAPQRLLDKEGEAAKLLGQMETIVRRGRVKGFIPWLITQRPAVLSKDVLSQVDGLIAFKLTSSQDRDAIGAWIEGQADRQEGREILASLPAMQRGRGVVWVPSRGILETATFPKKKTFDSSATPKRGEIKRSATLKPLNVEALKGKLATVAKEAEANDPKLLRARIAELERAAKQQGPTPAWRAEYEEAHARDTHEAHRQGFYEGIRAVQPIADRLSTLSGAITEAIDGLQSDLRRLAGAAAVSGKSAKPSENIPKIFHPPVKHSDQFASSPPGVKSGAVTNGALSKAGRLILTALAQHHPEALDQDRLAILAGYAVGTGHFNNNVGAMRSQGYMTKGWPVEITPAGLAALGDFEPLPTGKALLEWWCGRLGKAERLILLAGAEAYPNALSKAQLANRAGYEPDTGHFNNSLGRLRTMRLLKGRSDIRLSDNLA